MKNKGSTLFKVTGILAIVFGSLFCLGFIAIIPLLFGIPLIIGGVQYLKYADYTDSQIKNEYSTAIIIWTVCFFIAGGLVLGILSLVAYLNVTNAQETTNSTSSNNTSTNKATDVTGTILNDDENGDDVVAKIERLNKLKEQGLLTEEEYNNLKNELLKK